MFSFVLILAGSIGMILGGDIWWFAGAAIIAFAGSNIMEPILPIFVGKIAQSQVVGTAMGVYSTIQFSGSFVGAVMVGLLLPYGFTTAILFLTAVGGTGLLLAFTMRNPNTTS